MTWFKNLKTVAKLALTFALLSAFMVIIGYQGISAAHAINMKLEALYQHDLLGLSAIKQVNIDLIKIGRDTRTVLGSSDKAEMQQMSDAITTLFPQVNEELGEAKKTLETDANKAKVDRIQELVPLYEAEVKETVRQMIAGDEKGANQTVVKAVPFRNEIDRNVAEVSDSKEKHGQDAYAESNAIYLKMRNQLTGLLGVAILLSLSIGYFIAQLIARPLLATVGVLEKVAEGDLTASLEIQTRDEVGKMADALKRATESMRGALSEVRKSAESMAGAAAELASASQELATGAQEQAASLEETTATMEEITSSVKQNADNAKQASQVASASRDTAEHGGAVVSEAVAAMTEINASSKSIVEIITTIDEIAFQTNLLALNAAVEAARAGEQGRGFAVVATEVRNLAQRSATSAKEIKHLIQDSVRKVENGSGLVNKSGDTLREIVGSVKKVTDIVGEIAAASREQSTGIDQVSKAMMQMDQVTQTNSSQTEELSATAQSLSEHARQLQGLVAKFRVDTNGRAAAQAGARPAAPRTASRETAASGQTFPRPRARQAAAGAEGGAVAAAPMPKATPHDHNDSSAFQEF
ncbi:MAG TPA: methyl-accepting chemotaxis protein [Terriglobales bacterium]|nr:methyl-accepting chemotaxis protein [Terriglobales bacterium]